MYVTKQGPDITESEDRPALHSESRRAAFIEAAAGVLLRELNEDGSGFRVSDSEASYIAGRIYTALPSQILGQRPQVRPQDD
jgi:hypothetical protein